MPQSACRKLGSALKFSSGQTASVQSCMILKFILHEPVHVRFEKNTCVNKFQTELKVVIDDLNSSEK